MSDERRGDRIIFGLQPVKEALKSGQSIQSIQLARGAGAATRGLLEEARRVGVKVVEVPKAALDRRAGTKNHQGVVAELASDAQVDYVDVETILERARSLGEEPLVLLLDEVQDPRNLGALIRSAHGLGAHGVVIPKNRSASVTPVVVKASAGAAELIPVARVTNLKQAIATLKEAGVWCAAATLEGERCDRARLDGPLALVLGSEGRGVRKTVAEACDLQVRIDLFRGFDSLNVSVAAGILLYEVQRQRRARQEA